MKLRTVWGFLPVFQFESTDEKGHAKGPFIWVTTSETVLAHELFHVKQWYVFFFIYGLLSATSFILLSTIAPFWPVIGAHLFICMVMYAFWESKWLRLRRETAAYGESLRIVESQGGGFSSLKVLLTLYAKYIVSGQKLHDDEEFVQGMIAKRFYDRNLF